MRTEDEIKNYARARRRLKYWQDPEGERQAALDRQRKYRADPEKLERHRAKIRELQADPARVAMYRANFKRRAEEKRAAKEEAERIAREEAHQEFVQVVRDLEVEPRSPETEAALNGGEMSAFFTKR